jgi:glucokinase
MGHLEAIGSGHGIHRHFLSLGGSSEVLDTKQIVSLAKEKDALAIQALYEAGAAVGKALAGAVSILDPEVIVITGGVADIGELWWSPMEESFRAELIDVAIKTPLLKGTLGAQAPLIGVAGLVWREVKDEH